MDIDLQNVTWFEAARENFYEALSQRNWSLCRAILKDIEDNRGNTWNLRAEMNAKMAEEVEDYDGAEHAAREAEERESRENANQDAYVW